MRITKDPAERKQELLDAALELFLDKGYDKTSVKDIVTKVGVTQGLLYYYFPSKEDIIKELAVYYQEKFVGYLYESGFHESPDAYEGIILLFQAAIRYFHEHTYLAERMHMAGNENLHDRLTYHFVGGIAELIVGVIKQGIADGDFDCPYPEQTAPALTFGVLSTVHTESGLMLENLRSSRAFIVNYIARVLQADEERLSSLFSEV